MHVLYNSCYMNQSRIVCLLIMLFLHHLILWMKGITSNRFLCGFSNCVYMYMYILGGSIENFVCSVWSVSVCWVGGGVHVHAECITDNFSMSIQCMYVSPFDSLMILWWQILGLSQIDGVVVQAYVLPVYTRRVIHVHVPLKKNQVHVMVLAQTH